MKTMSLRSVLISTAFVPLVASADCVALLHVDLKNPPATPTLRCPAPGDYTFRATAHKVRADLPDGTALIFDFDKRIVSSLDSKQKTFCQMKLGDFLGLGERVSPGIARNYGPTTRTTLEPLVGQDDGQILGHSASPYNLYLGAHIEPVIGPDEDKPKKPKRGGADTNSGAAPEIPAYVRPTSYGVEVAGALWLSNFQPGDVDRGELAVAECATVLRDSPGLRAFTDRLRKENLTILGGDVSVSILDPDGNAPSSPPMVSLQAKSFASTPTVPSDFAIPSDYKKVPPPDISLGLDES